MVEKSECNFEIVAEYETGIDAYDGITSDNPDLIMTDIRIPYISGIDLVKKAREVYPLIRIIIITGYSEFDYAKEAANLGVIGFISKPVTLGNIRDLLKKAEASLDNEFVTGANLSKLSTFYQENLPIIRENELYRLSGVSDVTPAFETRLRGNNISLDYPYFIMCMFDFDEIPGQDVERYDIVFSSIR
jgi:two-component system response regulator YesN